MIPVEVALSAHGRRTDAAHELTPLAALNFFPAFTPPRSGGEMRYWHFYSRLAKLGFRVQMVSPTYNDAAAETVAHAPHMTEFRVPKIEIHHRLHQFMDHALGQGECSAPVVAMVAARHAEYVARAREIIEQSRIVMFDYPLPLSPFLSRRDAKRPFLVYNSYNVERTLLARTMRGVAGRMIARWVGRYEKALCRRADLIFACSHEDAEGLSALYDLDPTKIYIVPNGVDTNEIQPVAVGDAEATRAARERLGVDPSREMALFMGSQHPPNIEAGAFLIREIAPRLPDVQFVIAGSVCGGLPDEVPANVRLFGKFEDEVKPALLQGASAAINPLFSGSGTNLKMLEFLAAGLPVVATPFGARGLLAQDGRQLCLAEGDEFADKLGAVLRDSDKRKSLAREARKLACERFDWDCIAEDAAQVLHHKTRRRVLVVNDYPVSPVTFGGKVRMFHLYRALGRTSNVTILTQTPERHYSRRALSPGVEEINVPENLLKRLSKKVFARLLGVAGDDLVAYLTVRRCARMRRAFARESRMADVIILSQPYMVPLVRAAGAVPIVYDSHDVAVHLKRSLYADSAIGRWALRQVEACEGEAFERASFVATCSEENSQWFRRFYPKLNRDGDKMVVVANGVDCDEHVASATLAQRQELKRSLGIANEPMAVFLGSGHPPNVEAARFIVEQLAPRNPGVLFVLMGGSCWPASDMARPSNVVLLYQQPQATKNRVLQAADVALNPLMAGSGTSIKVLDYMAAGATVVATDVGARGVEIEDGVNGIVCPQEKMSIALEYLLNDLALCHAIGARGAELARRRYDWRVTTRPFIERMESLLKD